jgi:hypothetical protein
MSSDFMPGVSLGGRRDNHRARRDSTFERSRFEVFAIPPHRIRAAAGSVVQWVRQNACFTERRARFLCGSKDTA